MKKIIVPALIAILMAFTLVGCGSDDKKDASSTTATSESSSETSAESSTEGTSDDMMDDGTVSDGNGIIGDAEDDMSSNIENMTLTTSDNQ